METKLRTNVGNYMNLLLLINMQISIKSWKQILFEDQQYYTLVAKDICFRLQNYFLDNLTINLECGLGHRKHWRQLFAKF